MTGTVAAWSPLVSSLAFFFFGSMRWTGKWGPFVRWSSLVLAAVNALVFWEVTP